MFTLLTLNIQQYADSHGPWPLRRTLIARTLAAADADVVALQAVAQHPDQEGGLSQADQLAQLVPRYSHVIYRGISRQGGSLGVALLSREPPKGWELLPLSLRVGLEDDQRRLLLRARFEFDQDAVDIYNAHFSWVPEQCADNVAETLAFLRRNDGARVLAGDLNAAPDSVPMRSLARYGLVDGWEKARPGEAGYTFPSHAPELRIDYVWCDRLAARRLLGMEIAGRSGAGAEVRASDHFGVKAAFDFR